MTNPDDSNSQMSVVDPQGNVNLLIVCLGVAIICIIGPFSYSRYMDSLEASGGGAGAVNSVAAKALAEKNGCMVCHKEEGALVGPAFADIAGRYKNAAGSSALLAEKVKKGGSGTWGEIPMPAQPQVADADLNKVIEWVLSIKSAGAVNVAPEPAAGQETPVAADDSAGSKLFHNPANLCSACHQPDATTVGPSLKAIADRYSDPKDTSTLVDKVKSGGTGNWPECAAPMPASGLDKADIKTIVQWILNKPAGGSSVVGTQPKKPFVVSNEDAVKGLQLFLGELRFKNRGPSCITCHDVKRDFVLNGEGLNGRGGVLAMDLSDTFSQKGKDYIEAMIKNPGFPVMRTAFEKHPVTDEEALYLASYLKVAGERDPGMPPDYGWRLFIFGVIGAGALLVLYSALWSRRKRESVNQSIYDRQIKSL